MKFISKNSNLLIVLRPGLSAQPLTGTPATPTISVRFQDGVANVTDEKLVEMMLKHPGFNADYIAADEVGTDPYAYLRADSEPTHVLTDMKYGHPVNRTASPVKAQLPPEVLKLIQDQATTIAKQIAPGLAKEMLQQLVAERKAGKTGLEEGGSTEVVAEDVSEPLAVTTDNNQTVTVDLSDANTATVTTPAPKTTRRK